MNDELYYRTYSTHLRDIYGCKVYKLPVNIPVTCPNRDGCVGTGGCIFCGDVGAGFENLSNEISIKEQLIKNMSYIRKRYKAKKFIAYFQNFTNTYMPLKMFKNLVLQSIMEDIVEIAISTRPDAISDEYLDFLKDISIKNNISITIELGIQTVNYKTLKKINRGHSLAEFIDAVMRIKRYGFKVCSHIILNLPWDDIEDTIESAKVLSAMEIDYVKLHSLYIVKNTLLANMYLNNKIQLIDKNEYIHRVITFLEYLSPNIVVQRLLGRAPKEDTIFVNWNTSWWKIKDEIIESMKTNNIGQGCKCDYLNGKAVRKFVE
ncbi:TIGR01212 family radical SAM protein [Clostridiisalibacter paucivorans]|uniref:TIGR01212 family radical SAM protein n=1 Tax=Clostridiisalibacter paucivorans TaxID=408753 RepID=UPI00047E850D|nr:TIGR01212 family radical SAM protein [Clostridiisalibacter paucivorans]